MRFDMMRLKAFAYEAETPAWVRCGTSSKKEQYEHTGWDQSLNRSRRKDNEDEDGS